jgi:YgiT-type zinc finger domain-containing protein
LKHCFMCEGDLEQKLVTVERDWMGKKIIIEDVPTEVCDQCGERYFDAETTLRMERIKKASMYPQEQAITIPAFVRKFDLPPNVQEG